MNSLNFFFWSVNTKLESSYSLLTNNKKFSILGIVTQYYLLLMLSEIFQLYENKEGGNDI